MKKAIALLLVVGSLFLGAVGASANAQPPTNGGNGGGASGQCTGRAADRPAGCHTSK